MLCRDKGDPKCPIWVIMDAPYPQDAEHGYLMSGGYGWFFNKMWLEARLPKDYFVTCWKPDLEVTNSYRNIINDLRFFKPTFIIPIGNVTSLLVPSTKKKVKKGSPIVETSFDKWAGSILTCNDLNHPHYIIPNYPPDYVMANYAYRDIQVSIDLGHVREEYDYWNLNHVLNPLPLRNMVIPRGANEVLSFLNHCRQYNLLSVDIETIRPRRESPYKEHAGLIYTTSFAYDPWNAISFSMWDYNEIELCYIWREMAYLLANIAQIGQNYFSFDSHHFEQMGFELCLQQCHDTMIRDHILWPELSHSLQDLTKRYTREPYYKDEGKQWSPKFKSQLQRYNCLDTCVTFEVFLEQEKEFERRPQLK